MLRFSLISLSVFVVVLQLNAGVDAVRSRYKENVVPVKNTEASNDELPWDSEKILENYKILFGRVMQTILDAWNTKTGRDTLEHMSTEFETTMNDTKGQEVIRKLLVELKTFFENENGNKSLRALTHAVNDVFSSQRGVTKLWNSFETVTHLHYNKEIPVLHNFVDDLKQIFENPRNINLIETTIASYYGLENKNPPAQPVVASVSSDGARSHSNVKKSLSTSDLPKSNSGSWRRFFKLGS